MNFENKLKIWKLEISELVIYLGQLDQLEIRH